MSLTSSKIISMATAGIISGLPSVFESASVEDVSVTMLSSTAAIVCYKDGGNSDYGTACFLTVSGFTITAETAVVFESAETDYISVVTLSSTKALVCYRDVGAGNKNTAVVLDISGTTITPGTPYTFGGSGPLNISAGTLTSTTVLVCYTLTSVSGGYGIAVILSISGTVITASNVVTFASTITSNISLSILTSTKAVVCYSDVSSGYYGMACVIDIPATLPVPGLPIVFDSRNIGIITSTGIGTSATIVVYSNNNLPRDNNSKILDISGTTITVSDVTIFGAPVESIRTMDVIALSANKILACYNTAKGVAQELTTANSLISVNNTISFDYDEIKFVSITMLSAIKAIVCYSNDDNSNYGTAVILSIN